MSRLQVLLASLCFGTTGTAQALGPDGLAPVGVGAARILVGGALLVALALARGGRLGTPPPPALPPPAARSPPPRPPWPPTSSRSSPPSPTRASRWARSSPSGQPPRWRARSSG